MESITAQRIPYSPIRVMFDAARNLEQAGREVIHLEIGRPDYDTPDHIVEAAIAALRAGKHHYAPNAGIPELRRAISEKYQTEYDLEYDPDSEIIVTCGVAEGIYLAVHAFLNPGDQVLIPNPRWINYDIDAFTQMVEPIDYSLTAERNFQPDPDELEALVTQRTRMIILSSPSNPTGGVIDLENLQKIADLVRRHNLLVLSDEIYERIIYPPARHTSIASLPGMREQTIVLNGFSKYFSMTGWRLGFAVAPRDLISPMLRYHQFMITSTNTFGQYGALVALTSDQGPSLAMVDEFQRRRDYLFSAVNELPGFRCTKPLGAFFLFPDIRETGMDGFQMAKLLLEKAGVASVAGECFGRSGAGHIRFSYANSIENLKKAVGNIRSVLV